MPSLYFVANTTLVAAPSDANDGKDRFGFAIDDGQFTAGRGLVKVGAFSGYTHAAGDVVAINDRADPPVWAWYEIDSKADDDTLVLGDLVFGTDIHNDSSTINVDSSDGPFATVGEALSAVDSAGDGSEARICDDGTHTTGSTLTLTSSGSSSSPNILAGATARGHLVQGGGGTLATIQATGEFDGTLLVTQSDTGIRHLDLDANNLASTGLSLARESQTFAVEVHGATGNGVSMGAASRAFRIKSYNNGSSGFSPGTSNSWWIDQCLVDNNATEGVRTFGNSLRGSVTNSILSNNGDEGIFLGHGAGAIIAGNVFYNNGSSGLRIFSNGENTVVANNTSVENGGHGYQGQARSLFAHNHSHSNTSGHLSQAADADFLAFGQGSNVTGDPLFKDADNGDFTPQEGSPLLNAGIDAGGLT